MEQSLETDEKGLHYELVLALGQAGPVAKDAVPAILRQIDLVDTMSDLLKKRAVLENHSTALWERSKTRNLPVRRLSGAKIDTPQHTATR